MCPPAANWSVGHAMHILQYCNRERDGSRTQVRTQYVLSTYSSTYSSTRVHVCTYRYTSMDVYRYVACYCNIVIVHVCCNPGIAIYGHVYRYGHTRVCTRVHTRVYVHVYYPVHVDTCAIIYILYCKSVAYYGHIAIHDTRIPVYGIIPR